MRIFIRAMQILVPAVLLLATVLRDCSAQKATDINDLFSEWNHSDSPGVAALVIREGEVVYQNEFGAANLDYQIPITGDSLFYMASVSKQFTAGAIALLAIEGDLELDKDVREYVPELTDYGKTITVRQLVHHTSGLPDFLTIISLSHRSIGDVYDRDEILDIICACDTLNFEPGEQYLYSNSGYFLLAEIVERVSGKTLREFADERFFQPLGMTRTRFHDNYREIVDQRVTSYLPNRDEDRYEISYLANFDQVGSGGLLSCTNDMLRWESNYRELTVGGAEWHELMYSRGVLNSGEVLPYAFGLRHSTYHGMSVVEHSGSMMGFRTHFLRIPSKQLCIVVLANLGTIDTRALSLTVADEFLREEINDYLTQYVGRYSHEELGIEIEITHVDGSLNCSGTIGNISELIPASDDGIFELGTSLQLMFEVGIQGQSNTCTISAARARGIVLTLADGDQ